jgi:hypothetical protein
LLFFIDVRFSYFGEHLSGSSHMAGASADADKRNRMQGKAQWGEGTDHFLMDFAGKTGMVVWKVYLLTYLLMMMAILFVLLLTFVWWNLVAVRGKIVFMYLSFSFLYFCLFLCEFHFDCLVDANILAGIRKEDESSTDEENAGVIHFPSNLRGNK